MSSMPFIVRKNEHNHVLWFNYNLDQTDNVLHISIRNIFSVDEQLTVEDRKVNIQLSVEISECDEPEIPEEEYLASLSGLYSNFSDQKMQALLSGAEMKPLLSAYEEVEKIL